MSVQSVHQFAEKVALVSDGASAFGRAAAMQLALQGCYVVAGFAGGDDDGRRNDLSELKNLGTLAHAVETDFSSAAGARALVDEVEKIYGRLDLLVNCLESKSVSSFLETGETDWTQAVDTTLKATFFVTQAAVKLMSARPKARIVNVVFGGAADENDAASAAARAGLISLTKNLAKQLESKFRVNAVEIKKKKAAIENLDAELFRPSSGFAADDAARAVLFLLSSEAAALNGQILTIE